MYGRHDGWQPDVPCLPHISSVLQPSAKPAATLATSVSAAARGSAALAAAKPTAAHEQAVARLRGVFDPASSQLAHELAKLGRLRFNAAPDRAAAEALDEAATALLLCYGEQEPEVALQLTAI